MADQKPKIYSVSQITSLIKTVLEETLPSKFVVTGEISDWKHHTSGHCYFSLKDENSVLPCVMWAGKFRKVKFQPENGMAVLGTGFIDVYPPQGKYQFYVDKLEPAGVGALQLAFEQMVKKLRDEGLFDDVHKKPLPLYPRRIGILTSESGAAIHDITDSIHNRWPCAKLFLYSVPVQGEGAAEEIAAALRDVNKRNKTLGLDILIVGRGGGSLEDLWAFNEEILARAIFDSQIPVISAVGHEIDTTIADLVADARASTPTKAGVVAVPDIQEVMQHLANAESRLLNQAKATLKLAQESLKTILAGAAFQKPLLLVRNAEQQLDELSAELTDSVGKLLVVAKEKLHTAYEQISKIEPHRLLGKKTVDLNNLQNRTNAALKAITNKLTMQLTAQANRLAALNPKSVLQRGYSITTKKDTGLVVKSPKDVKIADKLITELAGENLIESKVTKKQNKGN
jgi:exodeoxyribonuclease VII large subunit